jgi:hypothetical protein
MVPHISSVEKCLEALPMRNWVASTTNAVTGSTQAAQKPASVM